MQSKLAAKKLRAYMQRAKRAVKVARESNPDIPINDTAIELDMLKFWLNSGIKEIKRSGLDTWIKTV